MHTKILLMVILFGLSSMTPLLAREKTDVIVMKNGDRITCEVKSVDSGGVYASVDYIDGTVKIEWSKVARIDSTQPFIVRTQGGSVYAGTIKTTQSGGEAPLTLAVVGDSVTKTLPRDEIVSVDETSENVWQRFNGAVGIGVSYTKGNQATQYNFNSDVEYLRERWSATATYLANLSASSGSRTSNRNQLDLTAARLLRWNNYYCTGLVDFLQSSTQDISRQSTLGAGIGRYLVRSNRATWTVQGGMSWQNTIYGPTAAAIPSQNLSAAVFASELKIYRFKKTNLHVTAYLFPGLSEPGRVRFNTNATYYLKLFSDLNWNVTFYGNWDNNPPRQLSGSDYGTTSGLSWTFGAH
jgi:Protein of unknown function, DUF481